ncbi:hypothetical protein BDB01DRAFT_900028 [Pilobolus umbonatus]|nr:hypothetical protein BDB01DRAFT_900028 [Pilobolus umbonatus]
MVVTRSQSFQNKEDSVTVFTRPVPPSQAHLYPRLAGSNWTCYINQPSISMGRDRVDIVFGQSKVISRKHVEIRYSSSRDRFELYVYSRNGIRVDHKMRRSTDRPVVLKNGALLEIKDIKFVFILPENYIRPSKEVKKRARKTDLASLLSNEMDEPFSITDDSPVVDTVSMDISMDTPIREDMVDYMSMDMSFGDIEEQSDIQCDTLGDIQCDTQCDLQLDAQNDRVEEDKSMVNLSDVSFCALPIESIYSLWLHRPRTDTDNIYTQVRTTSLLN